MECALTDPEFTCGVDLGRLNARDFLADLQGDREISRALELSLQQTVISIPFVEELLADSEELIELVEEALVQ